MPKMKTKKAAAKRFKITASGKLKHGVAGKRHRLMSHNGKYIRQNRGTEVVAHADTKRVIKKFLPNGLKRDLNEFEVRSLPWPVHVIRCPDKGFRGARSKQFRTATAAVWKAGQYAYVGRKVKKRSFRSLWIQRINAAVREHDENMTYSRFIGGLGKAGIEMDRKVMSDLAIKEPAAFGALVEKAKAALA
eukprot:CAMPEP_0195337692 /NCGR_PEP_ID=MMETSP0708-20121125/17066_1 /TAXON_ID=33640 /ORGANISM="Asterionellopsis glacialis, Strain CCMP134" /LENGTH=189 /DNA_ID=CAMNT_0040408773 /DNA_START=73 /DNA_END=644 /DNA_ORIENTATION=+